MLAYHAIGTCAPDDDPYNLWVSRDAFAQQMAFLAERRQVVPLAAVVEGQVPAGRPAVAITFDDGYRSVLEHAVPVLERHGFPATIFVPTAFVGDRNRWNPPQACDLSIVDRDEARELERRGVRVESHGHQHLDLRETDPATTRRDLADAWIGIEQTVGHAPRFLAYPFRDGSDDARLAAREQGFDAAFSIDLPHQGRYGWGRVQVTPLDSQRVFRIKTSGRWLTLRYHPVTSAAYRAVKRILPARTPSA